MDIYEAINARRSVRTYTADDVPCEILERILDAARMAPSAGNRQEWRFIIVKDGYSRKRLSVASMGQAFVAQAPVVLVCCADTDQHRMSCGQQSYPIDVANTVDHITLCAAAEGLGTCWIGAFHERKVKDLLDIPPEIRVVALLTMGWPADEAKINKIRLHLDEITMKEKWTLNK